MFELICSQCGESIDLKQEFNQAKDNTNKESNIDLFSLLDGTICISCKCGNEIYSNSVN